MKKLILTLFIAISFISILIGCDEDIEHIHNYEIAIKDQTKHQSSCSCGDIKLEEHIFGDWEVYEFPTEENEGIYERFCTVCDYRDTRLEPKIEHIHDYGDWQVETNPTDFMVGKLIRYCKTNHNHFEEVSLPVLFWNESKYEYTLNEEATCSELGYATYIYRIDDQEFKFVDVLPYKDHYIANYEQNNSTTHIGKCNCGYTDYFSHSFDNWEVKKAATCEETGIKVGKCLYCEYEKEAIIEKLDHELGVTKVITEATCTSTGLTQRKCLNCDYVLSMETEMLNHKLGLIDIKVEPTCNNIGYGISQCLYCDYNERIEYAKLDHVITDVTIKEATCFEDGIHTTKCINCHKEFNKLLPKLNHVMTDWIIEKEPTCNELGLKVKKCDLCNTVLDEDEIAKNDHLPSELTLVRRPTCNLEGLKEIRCLVCDTVLKEENIAKTAHNLTDWQTVKIATCIDEGKKVKVCTECLEEVEIETITKLNHNQVKKPAKAATCLETGNTEGLYCDKCNKVFVGIEIIDRIDHAYEKGMCKWCKEPQKIYVNYYSGEEVVQTVEYLYGDTFTNIKIIEDGNNYVYGWYSLDESIEYTETFVLTDDLDVYAKWLKTIEIKDSEGLLAINDNPTYQYYLANDINLEGLLWSPIVEFSGVLDGKGHTIHNFIMNTTTDPNMAFVINNYGVIKNLKMSNVRCTVSTSQLMNVSYSLLVANNHGAIDNVTMLDSQFDITYSLNYHDIYNDLTRNAYISSIAAINNGTISNSKNYVDMDVKISSRGRQVLTSFVGSIAGLNNGMIDNCYAEFAMDSTNSGSNYGNTNAGTTSIYLNIGGLIGSNAGEITKSISNINFNGTTNTNSQGTIYNTRIGGLVGNNSGKISESISYGSMIAQIVNYSEEFGGFVGLNSENGFIKDCYSRCDVQSKDAAKLGGFVGYNKAIITTCYAYSNVSSKGSSNTAGFAGYNYSSGSISNSFSLGNVSAASGSIGYFVGGNAGSVFKVYYADFVRATLENATNYQIFDSDLAKSEKISSLASKEFLSDKIYWNTDVWAIYGDDIAPKLIWDFKKDHFENAKSGEKLIVIEPTCNDYGYTVHICNCCDRIYTSNYVDMLSHSYEEIAVKNPTCTENGVMTHYICTNDDCKKVFIFEDEAYQEVTNEYLIISSLGHSTDINLEELEKPACDSSEDYFEYEIECSVCHEIYQTIMMEKHNIVIEYLPGNEPTCITSGLGKYYCSICNEVINESDVVLALGHIDEDYDYLCDICKEPFALDATPINSFDDLLNMKMDGKYILKTDLDFNSDALKKLGLSSFEPIGTKDNPFTGLFYGNGKTIKNLNFEITANGYAGLFGYNEGLICGLTINNFTVDLLNESGLVSPFVVYNKGTIYDCSITGINNVKVKTYALVDNYLMNKEENVKFEYGGFACFNYGDIRNCQINATTTTLFNSSADVTVGWSVDNFVNYYYRNTKAIVNLDVVFGYITGTNSGKIINCNIKELGYQQPYSTVTTNHVGHAKSTLAITIGVAAGINLNGSIVHVENDLNNDFSGNISYLYDDGALAGSFWSEYYGYNIYNDEETDYLIGKNM